MITFDGAALARLLRALAGVERLSLVALCLDRPVRVSDLAQAVGDSEPTVSRVLRQLADCGVLRRVRRGQSVEYGVADADTPAGRMARLLLAQIGDGGPELRRARARLVSMELQRSGQLRAAAAHRSGTRLGRALRAALRADLDAVRPRVALVTGCAHLEVIAAVSIASGRTLLLADSIAERARLRRWCLEAGIVAEVFVAAPAIDEGGVDWCLAGVDAAGEATATQAQIEQCAARARSWLAPGASFWLYADYDALEAAGTSPPAHLQALIGRSAMSVRAVRPVEADSRHLLLAHAATPPANSAPVARRA
jgi:DNA-binding transcriptional ArsR family regulator